MFGPSVGPAQDLRGWMCACVCLFEYVALLLCVDMHACLCVYSLEGLLTCKVPTVGLDSQE